MARKSFSVHSDFYGELNNLTAKQRGMLLLALIAWASDGETVELDPMCAMLYRMMTAAIERISKINSLNGSNGGRGNKSEIREETGISEESDTRQIKPTDTISVTDTVPDTVSTSNNNMNIADKKVANKTANKTKHGVHGYVLLSADELTELVSIYDEDKVNQGIDAVDGWANRKGNIPTGIDWQGQVQKAITKWNFTEPQKKSEKPNYEEDL